MDMYYRAYNIVVQSTLSMLTKTYIYNNYVVQYPDFFLLSGFCLGKISFLKMEDLISYFKTSSDVLCCRLTDICPKLRSFTSELSVSEIDRSAIQLTTKLSSNHREEVWVGVWEFKKKETTPVLVRKLSQLLYSKSDITREVEIVRKLRHENIIQLYGMSTRPELLCIVSESMENGNLLCVLREGKDHCAIKSFAEKIKIAIQIACGMDYLQSQKCVLCNLAAVSVFVNGKNIAKITNFQSAKILLTESSELASPIDQFLYRWSPPEVMLHGIHSLKSDIWSFGMVIAEIITNGREPYSELQNKDEVRVQVENHYVMPQIQLTGCPDSLYEVLLSCWRYDASCRPTVEFIITGLQDCVPLEKNRSN